MKEFVVVYHKSVLRLQCHYLNIDTTFTAEKNHTLRKSKA